MKLKEVLFCGFMQVFITGSDVDDPLVTCTKILKPVGSPLLAPLSLHILWILKKVKVQEEVS